MILVTGGTGLVGSHLLLKLCSKSEKPILAIYRNQKSIDKCKKVFASEHKLDLFKRIKWHQADVTDYYSLKDLMENITLIYHAAATVSFSAKEAEQLMKVNVEGTTNLVNLALDYKIKKFCYVSSVAALGEYAEKKCSDEETIWQKTKLTSYYSVSKYYAENEVWRASQEGLAVVIVNPATIIGYGDWSESSSTIVKRVAKGLTFYPSGANGFVGVKDVVNAMTQLMNSEIINERFVLVSENLPFKKLFDTIANQFEKRPPSIKVNKSIAKCFMYLDQFRSFISGQKAILTRESLQTAFKDKCYSSVKIETFLGFSFTPMEDVIKEACLSYKDEFKLLGKKR